MGRRRDRLTFVPLYSSIRQVWGNAHVLVMASRLEGLPLALAEALTLGSPAVVTDVADCAILLRDGVDRFVAAASTVSAYAKSMERLWERRSELPQTGASPAQRARDFLPHDPIRTAAAAILAAIPNRWNILHNILSYIDGGAVYAVYRIHHLTPPKTWRIRIAGTGRKPLLPSDPPRISVASFERSEVSSELLF
jgi:hypothetical protein